VTADLVPRGQPSASAHEKAMIADGKPPPRLHTPAEIEAAGRAAVADWPPLPDAQIKRIAALIRVSQRPAAQKRAAS
jgi:hypothetical protein